MTEMSAQHEYQVGDSVLADVRGAPVPGVIEGQEGGRFLVRLAQPWTDESGESQESVWLSPDQLRVNVGEPTDHMLPG
jgi:hypothetical protein